MSPPVQSQQITQILARLNEGHASSADELLPLVYDELRALAASMFRSRSPGHTLQPTALVHEVYARLVASSNDPDRLSGDAKWTGRAHFFAVAAKAMRQVLANHARDHQAAKRGGGWHRITLGEVVNPSNDRDVECVALHEALERLAELDERQYRIVELRFFAEMTLEEIARLLDISVSTVEREWRMARAWLSAALRRGEGP